MAFCTLASLTVGLLFGLAPAWQVTGMSVAQAIATETRTTTRGGRFRNVLVVAEVAAAVLVLCGAGLMLRTLISLQNIDPGNGARDVLTMALNLPVPNGRTPTRYDTQEAVYRFYDAVEKEVRQIAGIRSAAIGAPSPWTACGRDRPSPSRVTHRRRDRGGTSLRDHMVSPPHASRRWISRF